MRTLRLRVREGNNGGHTAGKCQVRREPAWCQRPCSERPHRGPGAPPPLCLLPAMPASPSASSQTCTWALGNTAVLSTGCRWDVLAVPEAFHPLWRALGGVTQFPSPSSALALLCPHYHTLSPPAPTGSTAYGWNLCSHVCFFHESRDLYKCVCVWLCIRVCVCIWVYVYEYTHTHMLFVVIWWVDFHLLWCPPFVLTN